MAYEIPGFEFTLEAAADLSGSQYCGVNVDADGNAALGGDGGRAIGVVQNKPKAGEDAAIMVNGVSKGKAGAAFTAGDNLSMDATGRFVEAVAASGDSIVAVALEDAGAADEIVTILILPAASVA